MFRLYSFGCWQYYSKSTMVFTHWSLLIDTVNLVLHCGLRWSLWIMYFRIFVNSVFSELQDEFMTSINNDNRYEVHANQYHIMDIKKYLFKNSLSFTLQKLAEIEFVGSIVQ